MSYRRSLFLLLFSAAAALFLFSGTFLLSADDTVRADEPASGPSEPDKTEIILPQMYLEIEDLTIEEIDAVIPDDTAVMLASLQLPLPTPGDIEIPAGAFALTDADAPSSFAASDAGDDGGNAFFSEGTIGVGTSARITGDINLYHIGEQPDFRLRYFHDSCDGFAGASAGEGFSSREELIEAELNYTDEKIAADMIASYSEFENGLQDQADYYTVTRRQPELEASVEQQLSNLFSLTADLNAGAGWLQLNSNDPASYGLFSAEPEAGIIFGRDDLNVGIEADYGIYGETDGANIQQNLGGNIVFAAEPVDIFRISGSAGVLWNNYASLYYPFELEISGTSAVFDYNLSGGYSAGYADRSELWDIFPAAAGSASADELGALPLTNGWVADGGFRWNLSDMLSVSVDAGFSMLNNALKPTSSSITSFSSLEAVDSTCFGMGAGMHLKITDSFSFGAAWNGQLLEDMDWFEPRHEFSGNIEYSSPDNDMGIIGTAALNIYDEEQTWYDTEWLPELGIEAYMRIAEGVELSIEGADIGAWLLDEGRIVWGDYLDEGSMLQAKIKISM